jgi:hypothetical protein
MQSITSPTTVAYRPAAMAALAAILLTAGFAVGMLVASGPLPIAPVPVSAPTTVQPQPGLLEFRRGEWTVGSTQAADQGLLEQRQGEQTVGAAAGVLEASQGLRDQRHGEITAGGSSADQGLRDQRHGEFGQRPR